MSSLNLIRDEAGATYIPSSQRPDGTWRKPIKVKDGYVPQEEQPLYVSKAKPTGYPVGLSASDFNNFQSDSSNTKLSGYFEVGNYQPAVSIPGLNFVVETATVVTVAKKKKNKSQTESKQEPVKNSEKSSTTSTSSAANQTDPVKRLRNLRKRLKDIETLSKKIDNGELQNPEKEQLEKINRKDEVLDEIEDLENMIDRLGLSS